MNPYTCRLLRRIDYFIYLFIMKKPFWSTDSGHLCIKPKLAAFEAPTFFPGWMYRKAAEIQNKYFWTRKILSI